MDTNFRIVDKIHESLKKPFFVNGSLQVVQESSGNSLNDIE